jgi:hypothetical protein
VANIHIDPTTSFQVHFVGDLPLTWQVIRVRAGIESVVVHGASTNAPPPPPDLAQVPAGQFQAGDTYRWLADLFAPPNTAANFTLRVTTIQGGKTLNDSGDVTGNIAANGDKVETGDFTCT